MPKADRSVHVRLSDEGMDALRALAEIGGRDIGAQARELLEEALLGKLHPFKMAAGRYLHATISGKKREG
jgi:plasmid stability protein